MKKMWFRILAVAMLAVTLATGACAKASNTNTVTVTAGTSNYPSYTYTPPPMTLTPGTSYYPPSTYYPSTGGNYPPPATIGFPTPQPPVTIAPYPPGYYPPSTGNIGLAVGGAKDINSFRNNLLAGYLPLPTDITYEGLFYDYYFDTGANEQQDKLFYPSYAYAVTRDPLSHQVEYYLSVGLNSGMKESDFSRKALNLVIVLDNSGSMGEYFNQYYYDNTGRYVDVYAEEGASGQRKMECAKDALLSILDQLAPGDRFSIVLFNSDAYLLQGMTRVGQTNMSAVERNVLEITAGGSTNLDAGIDMATRQLKGASETDPSEYENRIIVLTDAQPNTGDISSANFMNEIEANAASSIYATVIGVGVDFNTSLIERITKVKGANYYTVHSRRDFSRRMNEEFDFMVTPLVFNLKFFFEANGWKIDRVFGSPGADAASGTLMTINTLFHSKSAGGENKGGIVLLKLRKTSSNPSNELYLKVNYEDRNGRRDSSQSVIHLGSRQAEYFTNSGIQKAVLLVRYAALLKNWMIDERSHMHYSSPWAPCIGEGSGITLPNEGMGQWERTSLPLAVAPWYRSMFHDFKGYFEDQMHYIGDDSLSQELGILDKLD